MSEKKEVPIWQKQNLTIDETAAYSNIGKARITMMLNDPKCNFVLRIGNKRLVKRKMFDKYIESIEII